MNQLQERKRSMYDVVKDYIATVPAATLAQMPNFLVLFQSFTDKVMEINLIAEAQTWSRDGFVIDKGDYKLDMATQAANVALSVKAYANNTGDMALKKAMSLRASYITTRSENSSVDKCRYIHTKATELLVNLETYGVTASTLSDLEKSITEFVAAIPSPRTNIVNRKRATDQLAVLFIESENFLKAMDTLAGMLEYRDGNFYATYFSSRKIIHPSYRTLSLVGHITDAIGVPLNKVRVHLKGTLIGKLTTEKGCFEIKHLESKVYELVLEKAGYVSTIVEVAITATDRTEVTIVMPEETESENKTA